MLQKMAPGMQPPSEQAVNQLIRYVTGHQDLPVTVEQLPRLMIMLHDFTQQAMLADAMMEKFDIDNSGKLEIEELLRLLKYTLRQVAPDAVMSAGDVLYILTRCDLDGDMNLSRDELMPALSLWREIVPSLPNEGGMVHLDDEDEVAHLSRLIMEEEAEGMLGDVSEDRRLNITDGVDQETVDRYGLSRSAINGGGEVHWLENVKVVKEGISKSVVRTTDGKKMLVDNSELKQAQRVQAKRISETRAVEQAKLSAAAILLDEELADTVKLSAQGAELAEFDQTFLTLNRSKPPKKKSSSACALL